MSRIERSVEIAATPTEVWAVVADLGSAPTWNPNVASVECSDAGGGLGATRVCEFTPRGRIEEVVSKWEPGREVWFAIGSHGGIRSADMGIVLKPAGTGTTVTAITDYHVAFGPLGPVIDRLTLRRSMTRMMDVSLNGLREHVEVDNREGSIT